jgi:DNA-directed RNA polymerase subunit beta'
VIKSKKIKKGEVICNWDPYNAVIVSEFDGKIAFNNIVEGRTYREESDEQTGFSEKVITERKDRTMVPQLKVTDGSGEQLRSYNLPVGAHIVVEEATAVKQGDILVKIPRSAGGSSDITGGLPRVTELFEARNPSNPAVVSEIDGYVSFGKIKRGNQEIIVTSKTGEVKKYLVSLSKHILAQENDWVKAGQPLSDGAITPGDILSIKGPTAVQEYIVNEIQEVYRMQGVKINDKHFEVIVRQMMRKVDVVDAGDTKFLEKQIINKSDFQEENDWIYGRLIVTDAGDSNELKEGQIVTARKLRDVNSRLKRNDQTLVQFREALPATSRPVLQGITRASLQTGSFISAASFQETTKVLNEAAVKGKEDHLLGLKENVIVGHLIPAGTGLSEYENLVVGSKEEYNQLMDTDSNPDIIDL